VATAAPDERIATLDIVRGVAVMGILAMNVVAFAMPFQAYMNPAAYGAEGPVDYAAWAFNFIFIDGKMRGLFSFLFGASMLLVIERAKAAGEDAAGTHFRRMAWLLVFGLLHFTLIWFGDILAAYALVGMAAYLFHTLPERTLVRVGIGLVAVQTLIFVFMWGAVALMQAVAAQPDVPPEVVAQWREIEAQLGVPDQAALAGKFALFQGGYLPLVGHRIGDLMDPFAGVLLLAGKPWPTSCLAWRS
jgi:uncharacterized protein